MTRSSSTPRGFTLIELMVGLTVNLLVITAVAVSIIGMQRAYSNEVKVRSAVEGARFAAGFLEREIRMAGYGLHPWYAFNFDPTGLGDPTKDNMVSAVISGTALPNFTTDDLAFRYRDPGYLRMGYLSPGGSSLTLVASPGGDKFGAPLKAGQAILLACEGGLAFATVRLAGDAGANDPSAGVIIDANLRNPADATPNPTCLQQAGSPAYVMLIREVRIRITELEGRPYLVRYTNHQVPDAANTNFDPIAADVESFHVSYVINRPSANSACCGATAVVANNWVMLDEIGESTLPTPHGNRAGNPAAPDYGTPYDHPSRFTSDPANIRMVRLTVVSRSASRDQTRVVSKRPQVENQAVSGPRDGYYRAMFTTSVRTPNLMSKSFFIPPLRETSDVVRNEVSTSGENLPRDLLNNWGA